MQSFGCLKRFALKNSVIVMYCYNIRKDDVTDTASTAPKRGWEIFHPCSCSHRFETYRLRHAGADSYVAVLSISALKRLNLGRCSAARKFAPDQSCCGSQQGHSNSYFRLQIWHHTHKSVPHSQNVVCTFAHGES